MFIKQKNKKGLACNDCKSAREILYTATILFIAMCNFSSYATNNRCLEKQSKEKHKQDTIKVEFGNQFVLYWDCVNDIFVRDSNFYAILKNRENMRALAYFITDKEIVCKSSCNKKTTGEGTGTGVVGRCNATPLSGIIGYYTLLGQKLPQEPQRGIYIILYDNGKSEKVAKMVKE